MIISIRWKFFLITIGSSFLGIIALLVFLNSFFYKYVEKSFILENHIAAQEKSIFIEKKLLETTNKVTTLAEIFSEVKKINPENRRSYVDEILKKALESNEFFLSVWIVWEPNALDNMDKMKKNTPGATETGRFAPGWVRGEKNTIYYQEYMSEKEILESDYYQIPKKSKQFTVLEPYFYSYSGKKEDEILMTSLIMPIFIEKQFVGAVGIDIGLQEIQKMLFQDIKKTMSEGYAFLINTNGVFITHPLDSHWIGKNITEYDPDLEKKYEIKSCLNKKQPFNYQKISSFTKQDVSVCFNPIHIGYNNYWYLASAFPLSKINRQVSYYNYMILIIALISFSILLILILWTSGLITKPIRKISSMMNQIALGSADLTQRVPVNSKDEVGEIAASFSSFISKLHVLIHELKEKNKNLILNSENVYLVVEETEKKIKHLFQTFQDINNQSEYQKQMVAHSSENIKDMVNHIQTVNEMSSKMKQEIEKSAQVIEDMSNNIIHSTEIAEEGDKISENLKVAAKRGKEALLTLSEAVKEVAKNSEKIKEMIQFIMSITQKTNLLAMNAAIEAAHAGESGKGFAVVAQEIRKLSDKSAQSAQQIQEVLKNILESIKKNLVLSQATENAFLEFEEKTEQIRQANADIAFAMENQKVANQNILEIVSALIFLSENIAEELNQYIGKAKTVNRMLKELNQITDDMNLAISNEKKSTGEISEMAEKMRDMALLMKNIVQKIEYEFSQFKTE